MTQRLLTLMYFMLLLVNEKCLCHYSGIDFTTGPFAGLRQACEIKEKEITMKRDGCEPAVHKVHYCSGQCLSSTTYHHVYPFYKNQCYCCKVIAERAVSLSFKCSNEYGKMVTNKTIVHDVAGCECEECEKQ